MTYICHVALCPQVTPEQARKMVVIQPGLLFDTAKQAETLKNGITAISFELDAPKEEVSCQSELPLPMHMKALSLQGDTHRNDEPCEWL